MTNCKKCEHHSCLYAGADRILSVECGTYTPHHKPKKPQTNADRIRAMSDEELAIWIETTSTVCECCSRLNNCAAIPSCDKCVANITEWLKQPAEEVDDG